MAELAKDNIFAAIDLIEDFDPKIAEEIRKNENTIDCHEDSLGDLSGAAERQRAVAGRDKRGFEAFAQHQ